MAIDLARISYDWGRRYTGVAPQQGRVTLEAEENEERTILSNERRLELLDLVGPAATPDGGYAVSAGTGYDLEIGPGTMYVGGNRVELEASIPYSAQPDWLDHAGDPEWTPVPGNGGPGDESIVLVVTETDVTATEDPVLREVALGGPDGAARTRFLQRVHRLRTTATDCSGALATDQQTWLSEGLEFDPTTARLKSLTALQVTFDGPPAGNDPCQPTAKGGYLGAENQAIRVKILGVNLDGTFAVLWGWDNASFLYRVTPDTSTQPVLTLDRSPVDDYHRPAAGQAVEVLRSAAVLTSTDETVPEGYVASLNGIVGILEAPYDPDTKTVQLPVGLPPEYTDSTDTPLLYMRVWQGFTMGNKLDQPISLPGTGLSVTLTTKGGAVAHAGDFWTIGVRPSTPDTALPARLLREGQPPDGPRMWACPLAVIGWQNGQFQLVSDCRVPFPSGDGGCCCTVSTTPAQASAKGLQAIIDAVTVNRAPHNRAHHVTVCLSPGRYELEQPIVLTADHSYVHIEGCGDGVVISARAGSESAFADGLISMTYANNVRLTGLELQLPQVPAAAGGVKPVEQELSVFVKPMAAMYRGLTISIGIRPIHCAVLEVEDCLFRFTVGTASGASPGNVFGVGIFAGSECWGMRVERCRFLHDAEHLRASSQSSGGILVKTGAEFNVAAAAAKRASAADDAPLQLLVGLLLMPSLVYRSKMSNIQGGLPSGALVRTLLTRARIEENQFSGLTVGVFVVAELGELRIEDNSVRDCYGGVWLASIKAQAYADVSGGYTIASKVPQSGVTALANTMASAAADEQLVSISVLARTYPLPAAFIASASDRLVAARVTVEAHKASQLAWMEQFVAKAFSPFVDAAATQDVAGAEPGAPAPAADPAPAAPADAPVFTAGGTPKRTTPLAEAADNLVRALGSYELGAAFSHGSRRFELRLSGNDIECAAPFSAPTGPALLVWESDALLGSALINDNRLISYESGMTAIVLGVPIVLFNANLVTNFPSRSWAMIIALATGATVTANVVDGRGHLPPRTLSAPFDKWDPFNTLTT